MIAGHIHDALAQVRKLQELILEKRSFRGYSGKARMVGAAVVLAGAIVMSCSWFPRANMAHLIAWGSVLGAALVLNYGALFIWFLFNPQIKRNVAMLVPAIDAVPALAIGAILSLALIIKGEFDFLFGVWMCLYGLAHVSYRQSLPPANYAVGTYYMLCGTICLLWPEFSFLNPWPMSIVFFVGELAGGYILHRNNRQREKEDNKLAEEEGEKEGEL
jgi:hypothetical protein